MKRPTPKLLREALKHYGKESQENKCIEEMAELTAAILQFRQGRISRQELVSEMVDVEVTLEQLKMIHAEANPDEWDSEMEYKEFRLQRRINGGDL